MFVSLLKDTANVLALLAFLHKIDSTKNLLFFKLFVLNCVNVRNSLYRRIKEIIERLKTERFCEPVNQPLYIFSAYTSCKYFLNLLLIRSLQYIFSNLDDFEVSNKLYELQIFNINKLFCFQKTF